MSLPLGFIDEDFSDSESDVSDRNNLTSLGASEHEGAARSIEAVIVHTNSIVLRASVPQFASHLLLPTDAIFASRPSTISKVFNIPLSARAVRPSDVPDLAPYLREAQVPNLLIRSLFRNCDVTSFDETAGAHEWDHEFGKYDLLLDGPVLLARKDRKPLHPMQVKMILEYLEKQVDPMFDEYQIERKRWRKGVDVGEYIDKINEMRGNIEDMVKKPRMRAQWEKFQKQDAGACAGLEFSWDD